MSVYCSHFGGSFFYVVADDLPELLEFGKRISIDHSESLPGGIPTYSDGISLPTYAICQDQLKQATGTGAMLLPWSSYMKKRFELLSKMDSKGEVKCPH
jgi:hypothetical protein